MTKRTDSYGSLEYYSRGDVVDTYDQNRFTTHGGRLFDKLEKDVLLACVPPDRATRTLECGTGTGRFAATLGRRGYRVLATDASPGMVQATARRIEDAGLTDRVTVQPGDIYDLDFADGAFQFVYSIRVLNQFASNRDKARAIGEMARVVATGGLLLFDVVNRWSLASLRRGRWHVGPRGVRRILRHCGMEPTRMFGRMTLSQTILQVLPGPLASAVNVVDKALSTCIPFFGTRLYFLARKPV